jgi:hypothetical protein
LAGRLGAHLFFAAKHLLVLADLAQARGAAGAGAAPKKIAPAARDEFTAACGVRRYDSFSGDHQPKARLEVDVAGLLRTGEIGKPVMANMMDASAPLTPDAGLFLRAPGRCATYCGIVSMGLPGVATRQARWSRLSPAAKRGFFCRSLFAVEFEAQ